VIGRVLEVALDRPELGRRSHRADLRLGVERVPHHLTADEGGEPLLDLVQPVAGHDEAGRRGAGLPVVDVGRAHRGVDGGVEIGVRAQHERRLPAELEGDALDRLRRKLGDADAGRGGAGEADQVDVGVLHEDLTRLGAPAGDDVEHARRQSQLVDHVGHRVRRQRCHAARLDHRGAAGRHGRCHLGGQLVERVVPRRDGTDHAGRHAQHQRAADALLFGLLLEHVRHRPEDRHPEPDLHATRDRERGADLPRHDGGELVLAGGQAVGDLAQHVRALLDSRRRPAGEGLARCLHGSADVVRPA